MTNNEFLVFRDQLSEVAYQICDDKARTYATEEDRLDNFKRHGKEWGIPAKVVLGIYMAKHLDSIRSFIRDGTQNEEGVIVNIRDARNYLDLLAALVEESKGS